MSNLAVRRAVTHGAGWIAGAGGPSMFAQGADRIRRAWSAEARHGSPRFAALAYFALGNNAQQLARDYLLDYYSFLGDFAPTIAQGALTSAKAIHNTITEFADAGCHELILFPCSPTIDQLRQLAAISV